MKWISAIKKTLTAAGIHSIQKGIQYITERKTLSRKVSDWNVWSEGKAQKTGTVGLMRGKAHIQRE